MYNFGKLLGLTLLSVAVAGILSSHKAFAADCDMLVPGSSGSVASNCINYVDQANTANVSDASGFVEALKGDLNSGVPADVTSANWIIGAISPDGTLNGLEEALAQSDVTTSVTSLGDVTQPCDDSGYNYTTNSVERLTQCDPSSDRVLQIVQDGRQILALRLLCGNAIGGTAKLTADHPPTGSLTLACNANATGKIDLSFSDPDGNTSAKLTVNYASGGGSGSFSYGSSGSYTRTVAIPDASGSWSATLTVADNGGSQNLTVTKSAGDCDSPPTGTLTLTCNTIGTGQVAVKFSDPNGNTSSKLAVHYSTGGSGSFSYGSSGSYTQVISAPNVNGSWSATLTVADYGGSKTVTVTKDGGDCNKAPTGSFGSLTCDPTNEEYIITAKWSDANGSTQAKLTDNGGAIPASQGGISNPSSVGSSSGTWYFKTTQIPPNEWPVHLQVQDSDGGSLIGYVAIASYSPEPNCNPVGTITAASNCYQVSMKLWDPNDPTDGIKYYLSANGAAKQGEYTFANGQNGVTLTQAVNSIKGFDYWTKNTIELLAVDNQTGGETDLGTATLPICNSIACGSSTMPGNLVAGEQQGYTVNVKITGPFPTSSPGPNGAKFTNITMGSQTTSSAYTPANPAVASNGTLTSATQYYTPQSSGTFTGSWTFSGGESNPASITCPLNRNFTVVYEPYFDVVGGDISAGQGFGSACTDDDTSADIIGYNQDMGGATPNYFGAGSRQGALATGQISQFASDNTNDTVNSVGGSTNGITALTDNSPPKGLSFANSVTGYTAYAGGLLQGENNTFKWCVPDYESSAPAPTGAFNPSAPPTTPGTYVLSYAGSTLPSMSIAQGVHLTVVMTNSVYLTGDITYQPYSGSTINIPQFNLLVKGGNMYVASAVHTLDGFYDAQPNGGGTGIIYTCATGIGGQTTDYNTCDQPLTFYGSVSAHEIVPGRTNGNVAKAGSTQDYPAEQFVFTPELWLSGAAAPTNSCANDPTEASCLYQSYTSLPPVL